MLDIETSGVSIFKNYITSICLVQFSPINGAVIDKLHFRFTGIPADRTIDNEEWRKENHVDEMEARLMKFSIYDGLVAVGKFLTDNTSKEPIIIANHPEFDIAFLIGYYERHSLTIPWKYSNVYDLGSFILGSGADKKSLYTYLLRSERWERVKNLYFENKDIPHDAFYDCVLQIELLMESYRYW